MRNFVWKYPWWIYGLLLISFFLLEGCASRTPYHDSVVSKPAAVRNKTSTGSLVADARRAIGEGQFSKAEVILERALRVNPRDAGLWHEMARVKYGQKRYGQAVQFCLKANSLAGRNSGLIRQNWLLASKAYEAMGESRKATEARVKAEAIR